MRRGLHSVFLFLVTAKLLAESSLPIPVKLVPPPPHFLEAMGTRKTWFGPKEPPRFLPRSQSAGLYDTLEPVVLNLYRAQRELNPKDNGKNASFLIENSPAQFAYCAATESPTDPNVIVISTGMIGSLLRDERGAITPESVNRMKSVIGVLGHEIAHPLDGPGKGQFYDQYGERKSSQIREFRADTESIALMRAAGYPEEGLYEAMDRFLPKPESGADTVQIVEANSSSHPEANLRRILNATAVTFGRYEYGIASKKTPIPVPTNFSNRLLNEIGYANLRAAPESIAAVKRRAQVAESLIDKTSSGAGLALSNLHLGIKREIHALGKIWESNFSTSNAKQLANLLSRYSENGSSNDLSAPVFQSPAYVNEAIRIIKQKAQSQTGTAYTIPSLLPESLIDQHAATLPKDLLQQYAIIRKPIIVTTPQVAEMPEGRQWWQSPKKIPSTQPSYLENFRQSLQKRLDRLNGLDPMAAVIEAHREASDATPYDFSQKVVGHKNHDSRLNQAKVISELKLDPIKKKAILNGVLLQPGANESPEGEAFIRPITRELPLQALNNLPDSERKELIEFMKQQGLASSVVSLLVKTKPNAEMSKELVVAIAQNAETITNEFNTLLKSNLSLPEKQRYFQRAVKELFPNFSTDEKQRNKMRETLFEPAPEPYVKLVEKLFDIAPALQFAPNEAVAIHQSLSQAVATDKGDAYFKEALSQLHAKEPEQIRSIVEKPLRNRYFASEKTRTEMARKYLESTPHTQDNFGTKLEWLKQHLPQASEARDEMVEKLLWEAEVQDDSRVKEAESLKSSNLSNLNPKGANDLSSLAEVMEELTPLERLDLIRFLNDPKEQKKGFSPRLEGAITRITEKAGYKNYVHQKNPDGFEKWIESAVESIRSKIAENKAAALRQLNQLARDGTPNEKVVPIGFLMISGKDPLINSPGMLEKVFREQMGLEANSGKERALLALFDVIPSVEKAPTLAYLLSRHSEGEFKWNDIFQIFDAVGIKGAQLGAIYNVFGDEISKEAEQLKNNANPLSKATILDILKKNLPKEQASKIKLLKVLNSASIKSVVLVEIEGQGKQVLGVRRPFAENKVNRNSALLQDFGGALKKRGIESNGELANALASGLKSQLDDELSMKSERAKMEKSSAYYSKMNQELSKERGAWKFEVPKVNSTFAESDDLIIMSLARGKSFSELNEAERSMVGPLIAESAIRGLFRGEFFNPDQHSGNFLFDTESKTIYALDPGQASELSTNTWKIFSDERYDFAQFLRALADKDTASVLKYGTKLSNSPSLSSNTKNALKQAIDTAFKEMEKERLSLMAANRARGEPENLTGYQKSLLGRNLFIALTHAFAKNGASFRDNVTFLGLKGLMVLAGETMSHLNTWNAL